MQPELLQRFQPIALQACHCEPSFIHLVLVISITTTIVVAVITIILIIIVVISFLLFRKLWRLAERSGEPATDQKR